MTTPILETKSLSCHFPIKTAAFEKKLLLKAVDGVDLRLDAGETLGLAGESGCGKSTLAKLVTGLIPPSAGTVSYRGNSIAAMSKKQLHSFRKNVQIVFQDPFSSLNPRMRVGEIIGEPLLIHGLASGPGKKRQVLELMENVGLLEDHYYRYPHEFSGGQRQRIGIARALAVSPELIIADEPVSALDISIQAQIINLLQELKERYSLSFLFIAHDLSVVRHICDRVAIMYLGRIVETGTRADVFSTFLHPYTEALLSAIPQINPGTIKKRIILQGDLPSPISTPTGCPFHTRCPYAQQPVCSETRPPLEEKEPGHFSACHFSVNIFR